MKKLFSTTAGQTHDIGKQLGRRMKKGFTIALKGDLGAGKTTFVQGLAKGLGVSDKYYVTSPTFNIINEYTARNLILSHIDLYRLGSVEELEYIGFDDLLDNTRIIVVEWPQLLEEDGFEFDLEIMIHLDDAYNRVLSMAAAEQEARDLFSGF